MIVNKAEMKRKVALLALFHLHQPILDRSEVKEENVEPVVEQPEHSEGEDHPMLEVTMEVRDPLLQMAQM